MKLNSLQAHEVIASGGYPSLEVTAELENGHQASASVPYGASAGTHEATVLTDNNPNRYHGQGMLKACANVNEQIWPLIKDLNPEDQRQVDHAMIDADGTPNKANFGGNAILAVSLAVSKAVAMAKNQQLYEHWREIYDIHDQIKLPKPMMVAIEGGKHADNTTDMQEYCLTGIASTSASENIRQTLEAYHTLKKILKKQGLSTNVGSEGAFAPNGIPSNEAPFGYLVEAIEQAGYHPGTDIGISIDPASSEFYKDGKYHLDVENRQLDAREMMQYYQSWFEKYPLVTVEDCFAEDDWQSWIDFLPIASQYGVTHIGDDLTVTSVNRLQEAIDKQAVSGVLIKLNQIGSVSETFDTCLLAKQNNLMIVPSHRGGGETNDSSMVDLAVSVGGSYIKVGPTRGERVSKYNRLMEIERRLG